MSSFDKDFGFECDYCSHTVGGGIYDFEESLELRKNEGWINKKIDGEWFNFCSEDCYNQFVRACVKRPTPKRITK